MSVKVKSALLVILLVIFCACFATPAHAQTVTPNLGLTLPNYGDSGWDVTVNNDFALIDQKTQPNLGYVTPSQYSGSLQAAVTAGDTNVNGNYII